MKVNNAFKCTNLGLKCLKRSSTLVEKEVDSDGWAYAVDTWAFLIDCRIIST